MPKRIPIAVARDVGRANGLSQVILSAWDGERTHIVTWGRSTEDCSQAAIGGNRIKDALGWPKDLSAEPSRVRALLDEIRNLREALYPLVVGCLEADAREDAPEFVNGEAENGRRALPECQRCCGSGATSGTEYVDVVIPKELRCPDCGGWGFLKHPADERRERSR